MDLGKFFLKSNVKSSAEKHKIRLLICPGPLIVVSLIASQILRGFPGLGEAALRLTVSALVLSGHFLSAGILEYKLVIYCVCVYMGGVCTGCVLGVCFPSVCSSINAAFGVITGIGLTSIPHLTSVIFGRGVWKPQQRILRTPG